MNGKLSALGVHQSPGSCTVVHLAYARLSIPSTLEAEDRGTVSVVFCDVYEFQQVVASIEPTRLVEVSPPA